MGRILLIAALLSLGVIAAEPKPRIHFSPKGKHFVILERNRANWEFRFYLAAENADEGRTTDADAPAEPTRRPLPEDELLGKGTLPAEPLMLEVLDKAPRFVTLTTGRLACRAAGGKEVWRAQQIGEHHACWADESSGLVWFVTKKGEPLVHKLADGTRSIDDDFDPLDALETIAESGPHAAQAVAALSVMGDDATPVLFRLFGAGIKDADVRAAIRSAVKQRDPDKVLERLVKRFKDAEMREAEDLLLLGIETGSEDLHDRLRNEETQLLKLLKHGGPTVPWLADHFTLSPTSEAVDPLLKALKRNRGSSLTARRIIAALKPCTGRDFGSDPNAWLEAYKK